MGLAAELMPWDWMEHDWTTTLRGPKTGASLVIALVTLWSPHCRAVIRHSTFSLRLAE